MGGGKKFPRLWQGKTGEGSHVQQHSVPCVRDQGFRPSKVGLSGGRAVSVISRKKRGFVCPSCGGHHVTATRVGEREVMAGLMGDLPMFLRVDAHRVKCHDCGAFRMESYPFLSSPKSHITRQLERSIVELRLLQHGLLVSGDDGQVAPVRAVDLGQASPESVMFFRTHGCAHHFLLSFATVW